MITKQHTGSKKSDNLPGARSVDAPDPHGKHTVEPSSNGTSQGAIEAWSTRQSYQKADEKQLMGGYFAAHDFLVGDAADSETAPRQTVASILATNGTTGNTVGLEVLEWALAQQDSFDITWFTTGSVLPATLRKFKLDHPRLAAATQLFLFPGRVDPNLEAISGPEATEFVKNYKGRFTYAILGAYGFDIKKGEVYFHYSSELDLQNACARLRAAHKFLFLDSRKFEVEGRVGYSVDELLSTSTSVTIYTVWSPRAAWVYEKFKALCGELLDPPNPEDPYAEDRKVLRLRIVGKGSTPPLTYEHSGILKSSLAKATSAS